MKRYFLILLLLLLASPAYAATLYVDKDSIGGACNDAYVRAENDITHPFCTIERADGQVVAGDTVLVRAGTYTETDFALDTDGTSGSLITWQSYPRRAATISGMIHYSADYSVFSGFNITNAATQTIAEGFGLELIASNVRITDNYFYDISSYGIAPYSAARTNIEIDHNHFYRCSKGIRTWGTGWHVHDNIVERLYWWPDQFINDCDYTVFNSSDSVLSDNQFYGTVEAEVTFDCLDCTAADAPNDLCTGEDTCSGTSCSGTTCIAHVDCAQVYGGASYDVHNILVEGNMCRDTTQGLLTSVSDDDHTQWIFRKNVVADRMRSGTGIGVYAGGYLDHVYVYNNTFYDLDQYGVEAETEGGITPNYILLRNNIFHTIDGRTWIIDGTNSSSDYNTRYTCGALPTLNGVETVGAHDITSDPLLTGAASGNFRPDSTSPAIDAGGFLTTITTATGSGTSFAVDDAGYFWDGNGVTTGDVIELSNGAVRTITDITTNTITVDSSVSWTLGDGVALEYNGSAPDMGAYEYWGSTRRSCTMTGVTTQ